MKHEAIDNLINGSSENHDESSDHQRIQSNLFDRCTEQNDSGGHPNDS